MHYEESIQHGMTCFRTSPDGEWKVLSNTDMTRKIQQKDKEIKELKSLIEKHIERLDKLKLTA